MWTVTVLVCALMIADGGSQGTVEQSKVVNIAQGNIRGYKSPNYDVFQFLDVPYATAPIGVDRFKAPLLPPMFMGTFEAINRGIICPQTISILTPNPNENCLVANIHVPNTNETNLPVLVFVHGGAYLIGWGSLDVPNGLVSSKKIIAVTFNYRLGPHGFLCLGTEDAPGNAGMKDQVALLQWVKNNIERFGGNPDDITISGCSAGGSAVDLLLLSNMTNGLFNKVIAESGCSVNTFSAQLDPIQNAINHALNLGFTNVTDLNALAEFYKTTPVLELFNETTLSAKDSYFFFQPCVEKDIGQQRFLEDAPINILKSGNFKNVPVIYGYAKQEGIFRLPEFNEWSIAMNENFTEFLPADLQFDNETQKVEVASKVREFYFGNKLVNESTVLEYVDYFTDALILAGIFRNVALRVKAGHNETYLYEYSFTHNGSSTIPHTNGLQGATHCDQYGIIFDAFMLAVQTDERTKMALTMRDLIYNFITTGNPTPPGWNSLLPIWPPVGSDRSPHYSIGDTIEVAGIPAEERSLFWDEMYESYGATPQPPLRVVEADPTSPPEPTTQETTESIPQVTTESTTQETTETPTVTATDEEEPTTTPEPNSATLKHTLSYQFWILYAVVILTALK